MDVFDTIKKHRSIRKYKDRDVKQEDLDKILEAAQLAPSSINGQQWSIIVVKNDETKKQFAELTGGQEWVAKAPVFLVFVADYYRAGIALKKEGKEFKNIQSIEATMVSAVDVGLAFSNAMNVAEQLGYGIVPIGAVRRDPDKVIELLDLPELVYPVVGMCIGVPDEDPMVKPRFPKEAMIHQEKYNRDLDDAVDEYDDIMRKYMDKRTDGEDIRGWSEGIGGTYSVVYFPEVYGTLKKQGFKNDK